MCLIKERIHELYENQQLINNLNIVSSDSTASKDSRCQASTTQIHCCKAPNFAIHKMKTHGLTATRKLNSLSTLQGSQELQQMVAKKFLIT